ncbi:MAG: hypothetical protein KJ630_12935 [Proteobacteria bacterium]|nr:hypothetical protein [Pseudomonadota bacterium]
MKQLVHLFRFGCSSNAVPHFSATIVFLTTAYVLLTLKPSGQLFEGIIVTEGFFLQHHSFFGYVC